VISLHPNAAALYKARVGDLRAALGDPEAGAEIGALLRAINTEII
jgi:hypothetical protein